MRVKRDFEGKMIDDVRTLLGPGKQVDLVIAIDRSRGMQIDWFYAYELPLLEKLVRQYVSLDRNTGHIAVLTFAADVEVVFDGVSSSDQVITKAHLFSGNAPLWQTLKFYHNESRFEATRVELAMMEAERILERGRFVYENQLHLQATSFKGFIFIYF